MQIHELRIERYRGIESLTWQPAPGMNCLIGPGDAGKSTVLAAIELLFSARGGLVASEYDYHRRRVEQGFEIHAVVGDLPGEFQSAQRVPILHGWKAGALLALPDEDGAEPVIHICARGTPDLEIEHRMLAPSGEESRFGVGLRRRLDAARLTGLTRAFNEFRLARGTLLQRHAEDVDVRGPLIEAVASASAGLALPSALQETLAELGASFAARGLPEDLRLGVMSPRGQSLVGMLGLLTGGDPQEAIPYFLGGTGTKQLALFTLARALLGAEPLLVMDEPEHGLEPYRQRHLVREVRELVGEKGQAFLTTHSTAVLGQLSGREVHRLVDGAVTSFDSQHLDRLVTEEPEAFLARVPVLGEGATEVGLLEVVLPHFALRDGVRDLDAAGVHFAARKGQPQVLREARALADAGVVFGLLVDDETEHGGLRRQLADREECVFCCWSDGVRNPEEAVARWFPSNHLQRVVDVAAELSGRRSDSYLQKLGEKAGTPGTSTVAELIAELGETKVREALSLAMQHGGWFKSRDGGRALGELIVEAGPPPEIASVLEDFWDRLWPALRKL